MHAYYASIVLELLYKAQLFFSDRFSPRIINNRNLKGRPLASRVFDLYIHGTSTATGTYGHRPPTPTLVTNAYPAGIAVAAHRCRAHDST